MSRNIIAILAITAITCVALHYNHETGIHIADVAVGGLIGFLSRGFIKEVKGRVKK